MRKIHHITYNWRANHNGEYANEYTLGVDGVTEIMKQNEDNYYGSPYFVVHFEDGSMEEIYNPNVVAWKKVPEETISLTNDPFGLPF